MASPRGGLGQPQCSRHWPGGELAAACVAGVERRGAGVVVVVVVVVVDVVVPFGTASAAATGKLGCAHEGIASRPGASVLRGEPGDEPRRAGGAGGGVVGRSGRDGDSEGEGG